MLLLIELDAHRYVADVGFGGLTLTSPLRLELDVEQQTPHELFRLKKSGDGFLMQARLSGAWKSLYQFDLQGQFLPDYEVTNWYLSNHPSSHFVTGLIAARADRDRRHVLRGNELAVHHLGGETQRRVLGSTEELRAALEGTFQLTVPVGPDVRKALERVVRQA